MRKILFSISILGLIFAFSGKAYADCQQVYGGGQSCTSFNFTINKMVQVPGKGGGNFVNNLGINDAKFSPSQTINYQLVVTNTGSQTIPTLNVSDTFPQFVNFVSGAGSFNANTKTLTFTINNLGANQSQTFNLQAKIADNKTVPMGTTCVVNQANVNDNQGDNASDSSQACIQNSQAVLPAQTVTTTPATGPELLPLALLIPGGLSGLILRRKTGGNK